MKRLLALTAATAVLGFAASAASAQSVTGQVGLTGTVAPKCSVIVGQAGGNPNPDFGDNYTFAGDLGSGAGGTLSPTVAGYTTSANSPVHFSYQVVCNSADPTVTLTVSPMTTGATPPSSAYTSTIDFTGEVDALVTGTAFPGLSDTTAGSAVTTATTPLGSALTGGVGDITLRAYGFNASGKILDAGTYTGFVKVVVAPGT